MFANHHEFSTERVMIMSAPNGARRTKADHPAIPITPDEIANCAVSLRDERVSILHLHVRDTHNMHTLDAQRYRDAIDAVQACVGNDLILQVTTESVGQYSAQEQMSVVRTLRPEAVSLALRELCPDAAHERASADFFTWLNREKIWPQYILYSPDEVARFEDMRKRGVFADTAPFCLFVLGRYADDSMGDLNELHAMLEVTDYRAFPWAVCCFGRNEHKVTVKAAELDGHIRIGFENNLLRADGSVASSNAELVADFRDAQKEPNRKAASADDIRNALVWT